MFDPLVIVCALACGLLLRSIGFPALLGYLAAGFILHEIDTVPGEMLHTISELGVTLLLFTIGLKLDLRQLLKVQIWGTTLLHMAAMQLMFMGTLWAASVFAPSLGLQFSGILLLAFALTFSSTVFVIQVMQERGESASRHASMAIGILIIQDIAAIIFLGFSAGKIPQPEALWLLLLIPLRGVILRLLSMCGHNELFTLFGLALAIGGAQVFASVGIKADLGALILGALLTGDRKSKELAKNLLYFKDLFLVGFFVTIGLDGWPTQEALLLAGVLAILVLVKPLLYFLLLTRLHAGARVSMLASAALTNYSEFGLIVVVVASKEGWLAPQWSAALSLAIAFSFIISSGINTRAHGLYQRWQQYLDRFETHRRRKARPVLGNAQILVLGMGNIGTGAYSAAQQIYGDRVVGVDDNDRKLAEHQRQGRRVITADASDPGLWSNLDLSRIQVIMLALTNHQENILVGKLLRQLNYTGAIAAVVRFQEEADELEQQGMSTFNLFAEAGRGFAAHAVQQIEEDNGKAAIIKS
jgi:predicted Kef-type K+ transport protein